VLAYHAFPGYVKAGFIGVDVFFVISGYLITGILLGRRKRGIRVGRYLTEFYQHRVRRIFPALLLVLVASAIYGWFFLFPSEYQGLTKFIAGGAGFVNNFLLWSEAGYFDASIDTKPLMHLWSLAIEEQFYVVWPLLILLVSKVTRGRWFTSAFAALAVLSFAFGLYLTSTDPTAAYYSPLSRGWELAVGGILAALHARGVVARPGRTAGPATAIALATIAISGVFFIDAAQFPGWQALIPVLATATIIWFGAGTWTGRVVLGWRPIVFIGLISYPLYLWHWVLLSFLRIRVPQPPGVLLLAALAGAVLLAVVTYYLLERRVKRVPLKTVTIIGAVCMVVVFAFGLTTSTLGLSGVRLTPTQTALSQAYIPSADYRAGTCFLDSTTQTPGDFTGACESNDGDAILLWGDSLSAQLYPGLVAQGPALGYGIAQRTASSCPAATEDLYGDRGNCDEINASTREWIVEHRPHTVILDARWPEGDADRAAQLTSISDFLTGEGVEDIVLVGPAPDWQPDLRGILIRMTFPDDVLPEYMPAPAGTFPATLARDESLKTLSASLGVHYLSLTDELCRNGKCLIRVSDDIPAGLITSDHDHLTAQASVYLFDNLGAGMLWNH